LLRPREFHHALRGDSRGITLIEVLIAVAILGLVAVAFLSALATASTAIIIADERTTAESLARSELEYVKSQNFSENSWSYTASSTSYSTDSTYPSWWTGHVLASEYDGYSVIVTAQGHDIDGDEDYDEEGIWEITVKVYHNETPNPDDLVLTTTTYKVHR